MPSASTPKPPTAPRGSVGVRRVRGAVADELHLLARPIDTSADATAQAASAYDALVGALELEGASPADLVIENVFLRPVAADFAAAVAERRRAYANAGLASDGPATTFIGQAPLEGDAASLEVAAVAILPRSAAGLLRGDAAMLRGEAAMLRGEATMLRGDATMLRSEAAMLRRDAASPPDVRCAAACTCESCAPGFRARVIRLGTQTHLHAGNVFGRGQDAVAEAFDLFVEAEKLLVAAGMGFGDVIRTWIHLRDIDRDYAALNQARRDFFASRGIDRRPASTGVQGIPFAAAHDFSMSLFAVKSPHPLEVPLMSTPTLNEAWTYGADFSRGLRLVDDNKVSLIVSGTASIDECGASVHDGDLAAQVERMLRNIETLLGEQGAGFGDLVSAVTYVKYAADAPALGRLLQARGFRGFPLAIVEAPLCRPELLCETEAVAVLPLAAGHVKVAG